MNAYQVRLGDEKQWILYGIGVKGATGDRLGWTRDPACPDLPCSDCGKKRPGAARGDMAKVEGEQAVVMSLDTGFRNRRLRGACGAPVRSQVNVRSMLSGETREGRRSPRHSAVIRRGKVEVRRGCPAKD